MHDLDPFVCLVEGCGKAHELFNDEKDWANHIRHEHRLQWRCAARSHRKDGAKVFSNQKDFISHMVQDHTGSFAEDQLNLLAKSSARPSGPIFDFCPLCDPNGEQDLDPGNGIVRSPLDRHILNHLLFLALRSLPWNDHGEDAASSDRTSRPPTRDTVREPFDENLEDDSNIDEVGLDSDILFFSHKVPDSTSDSPISREDEWGMILYSQSSEYPESDPILRSFIPKSNYLIRTSHPIILINLLLTRVSIQHLHLKNHQSDRLFLLLILY